MVHRSAAVMAALAVLAFTGCQSAPYATPSAHGKPTVVVELPIYDGGFPNVHVQRIDGKWIPSLSKRLALAPGQHEALITCEYTGAFGLRHYFNREQLRFRVEAGRRYEVQVSKARGERRCATRVVDKSRKAVVSETLSRHYDPLRAQRSLGRTESMRR